MIPKIIHYFWFGKKAIPKEQVRYIDSWKKFCPDYEIKFWNEENYDIHKNPYMEQAYEAGMFGFVPDFARLDIIYQYGGFYFDTDVELLKNLDGLRNFSAVMGFQRYYGRLAVATGQGFGAEKNHPAIKELMAMYERRNFVRRDGSYNLMTSTSLMTKYMLGKGLVTNGTKQTVMGITILPQEYFCPLECTSKGNIIKITENSYTVHHFAASWKEPEHSKKDILGQILKKLRK